MTASATWGSVTTALAVTSAAVSVAKPTVSVGDAILMIVIAYDDAGITCTDPFGSSTNILTPVRESATEILNAFGWVRKIDGSEGSPLTATLSSSQYYVAIAIPITSLGATPLDTSAPSNGRASSQNLPAITTGYDDELLIGVKAGYNATVTAGPSGWTQRANYDNVVYIYDRTAATAGAVGSASLTASTTDGWCSLVAAFQSAAGGAPAAAVVPPVRPNALGVLGLRR